mmetsp:Transcript_21836/g.69702  ORF Transcript_21836/g.69702 Transcript_21836/m.69702 type:complete len:202 (-) Transcript_21836:380-985(-)
MPGRRSLRTTRRRWRLHGRGTTRASPTAIPHVHRRRRPRRRWTGSTSSPFATICTSARTSSARRSLRASLRLWASRATASHATLRRATWVPSACCRTRAARTRTLPRRTWASRRTQTSRHSRSCSRPHRGCSFWCGVLRVVAPRMAATRGWMRPPGRSPSLLATCSSASPTACSARRRTASCALRRRACRSSDSTRSLRRR